MTLFGDALKAYTTVQQLPMLPAMLAMKGAAKAGDVLKQHTFLGKRVTVKDASGETQKRIWRGSRFLRKHILEAGIDKLNTLTSGSIKKGVDRYADYHAFGRKLAERNANLSSRSGPSPKTVADLATRFRQGKETPEDKDKLNKLKLRYNPLTESIVSPGVLKASMEEEILKRFMQDKEALPPDTKALLQKLESHTLDEKDKTLLHAFGLKARPDGSLQKLPELPLTPLEQKLCDYFDASLGKTTRLEAIKDEVLKLKLRTIRSGQFEKLDEGMRAVFQELGLKIHNGVLVELPKSSKPIPPLPSPLTEGENALNAIEKELYQTPSNTQEDIQRISDM